MKQPYFCSLDDTFPGGPELLGGKGHELRLMRADGVNVPSAIIITTELCKLYQQDPDAAMKIVAEEIIPAIKAHFIAEFETMPLLSVRSGAKISMPGMMDTILNVGLSGANYKLWVKRLGQACTDDCMNRLANMYKDVCGKNPHWTLEGQLHDTIRAVFDSWNNDRAVTYRKLNNIPNDLGTAVVVQAMVFGNMNDQSCTGVLFTRDPNTGADEITGEFLVNAQGEDVVAGVRTPEPLIKMADWNITMYNQLRNTVELLEEKRGDMQDVEFTVQDGELFILQTRKAKRTAQAAIRVAVDLHFEGLVDSEGAMKLVSYKQYLSALRPVVDPLFDGEPVAVGIPASAGIVGGQVVLTSAAAVSHKGPCILVTKETTPDDISGMNAARGVLTATGGATSHAAVVARGMDKPCVVGCGDLEIGESILITSGGGKFEVSAGDWITIDGNSGKIWLGKVPVIEPDHNPFLTKFNEILESRLNYYRICTHQDEFNSHGAVLFATYLLDLCNENATIDAEMRWSMKALSGREAVVDLRGYHQMITDHEMFDPLLNIFAPEIGSTAVKVAAMSFMADKIDKKNIYVLENGLTENECRIIKEHGYKIIPIITTAEELKRAKGLCQPNVAALMDELGREGLQKLVAKKKKAGTEVKSFNIVTTVHPDELKTGAAFAMPRVNLIKCLLGG